MTEIQQTATPQTVATAPDPQTEQVSQRLTASQQAKAVAIEDIQHFKTFPVETGPSVLEQKAKPPIPNSNPTLTLPIARIIAEG